MGKANTELLEAIKFNLTLLDSTAQKADEMSALLGAVNGDRANYNATLTIRNQAYTHLKFAMDEIRQGGKFAFWKNKDRLNGYTSSYYCKHN